MNEPTVMLRCVDCGTRETRRLADTVGQDVLFCTCGSPMVAVKANTGRRR